MQGRNTIVLALLALSSAAHGQDRQLVIPQIEGEKQGRIIGRAIACGASTDRTDRILQAARDRMLTIVGRALTDERYVLSLNDAMSFEAGLPKPGDAACARAFEALERLETAGQDQD